MVVVVQQRGDGKFLKSGRSRGPTNCKKAEVCPEFLRHVSQQRGEGGFGKWKVKGACEQKKTGVCPEFLPNAAKRRSDQEYLKVEGPGGQRSAKK